MKRWDVLFRFALLNIWIIGIVIEKLFMQKYMFFASTFVFIGYFVIDFIRDLQIFKKERKRKANGTTKKKKRT